MSQDIQTMAEAVESEALPRQVGIHATDCDETGEKRLPDALTRKSMKQKSPQFSVALRALPIPREDVPQRRISFQLAA